jgi:pimeloyl-ACP methyl ester carboxylesterase
MGTLYKLIACIGLLAAVAGCMPSRNVALAPAATMLPPTATPLVPTVTPTRPTPTAPPPTATATRIALPTVTGTQAPIARLVSAGKYRLYLACSGIGSPTVVMDSGLGAGSSEWSFIAPKIAAGSTSGPDGRATRVCVYDRANTGRSDHAPTPRTSQDVVDDLHAILTNASVAGPYVMVGHSLGGLNIRLFASEYPGSVVGMVLVDAAHEDLWDRLLSLIPPPTDGEPIALKAYRSSLNAPQGNEQMDLKLSGAQVRSHRKPFGAMPLIVLSHGEPIAGIPALYSPLVEGIWSDMQLDLLNLSTNSKQIIAEQSGHDIPSDQPQLVIDATREVVRVLRGGAPLRPVGRAAP